MKAAYSLLKRGFGNSCLCRLDLIPGTGNGFFYFLCGMSSDRNGPAHFEGRGNFFIIVQYGPQFCHDSPIKTGGHPVFHIHMEGYLLKGGRYFCPVPVK